MCSFSPPFRGTCRFEYKILDIALRIDDGGDALGSNYVMMREPKHPR